MKKPKKSTKVLLIIIPIFIVLGLIFGTVGLLKGISIWYVVDGVSIKTSNMFKAIEETKEVEPFTSIKQTCPFRIIEIKKGDKFSVEYTSHQYLVEPEVLVEGGVLNIVNKTENKKIQFNGGTIIGEEKYEEENTLVITIPEGIVLEAVELATSSQLEMLSNAYVSNATNINDIAIKKLSVQRPGDHYNRSWLNINNCTLDNVQLANARNLVVENSQIGELILDNISSNYYESNYEINNSTINNFVTKYANNYETNNHNPYQFENITLQKSKILSADIVTSQFKAYGGEIANAKIAAVEIKIDDTVISGANDYKSNGNIIVNSAQQSTDLSCDIGRAVDVEGAITEIVGFDDPRYAYGYITMETMGMGTRKVNVSYEEYNDITRNGGIQSTDSSQYDYSNYDWTQASSFNFSDGNERVVEGNKFNDYISEEYTENGKIMTVYEKKAITYTVNADGYVSYLDLRGKASSQNLFLSIGVEKNHFGWQMSKPAKTPNSLKCYSEGGAVSVNFKK